MKQSKFQQIVGRALRFWLPDHPFHTNHRPDWLAGLELDFYIPSLGIAVEVQGEQHYTWVPEFHRSIADFRKQQRRDGVTILIVRHSWKHADTLYALPRKLWNVAKLKVAPLPPDIRQEWETHAYRLQSLKRENEKQLRQDSRSITPTQMRALSFVATAGAISVRGRSPLERRELDALVWTGKLQLSNGMYSAKEH